MKTSIFVIVVLWCIQLASAQAPLSQIYLFDLQTSTSGTCGIYHPRLLTGFNKSGYNNQPSFINENEILITSLIPPSNQTDIYSLNILTNTKQQITNTILSEYSPTLTPDKNHISCIRVDKSSTTIQPNAIQRLYTYELKPKGKVSSLISDIKNIGYHTWLNDKDVALFLVNKPSQLALVAINSKDPLIFTSDVGRCMTHDDKGHLIYVHKITETDWYIKDYDPILQKATILAETISGSEDFVLIPGGQIMMGKGSKLFMISPATQKTWTEVADLSYYGIQSITRLAFKGNHLVLVNQSR